MMTAGPQLKTERLVLRRWRNEDRESFAELNTDREVAEFLPSPLNRAESDALIDRIESHFDDRGFGLWAVATDATPLIGFLGLFVPQIEAHFTPCVEIGWRFARAHWGKGFATEGAKAALKFAFDELRLEEVVSFTTVDNDRSCAVMKRIGMTYDPKDDFDHPSLAIGHPLRAHVLYRIRRR